MTEPGSNPPGLPGLFRKAALTVIAALRNRGELFLVEFELEKVRVIELLIWTAVAGFLGMMFMIVLTGTVIFLFPAGWRIYAAAVVCLLYLLAAVFAVLNLRALWRSAPPAFSETLAEVKKDTEWLDSLK
jgi:uncharacterized membrane protein YqjE